MTLLFSRGPPPCIGEFNILDTLQTWCFSAFLFHYHLHLNLNVGLMVCPKCVACICCEIIYIYIGIFLYYSFCSTINGTFEKCGEGCHWFFFLFLYFFLSISVCLLFHYFSHRPPLLANTILSGVCVCLNRLKVVSMIFSNSLAQFPFYILSSRDCWDFSSHHIKNVSMIFNFAVFSCIRSVIGTNLIAFFFYIYQRIQFIFNFQTNSWQIYALNSLKVQWFQHGGCTTLPIARQNERLHLLVTNTCLSWMQCLVGRRHTPKTSKFLFVSTSKMC